ncbi:lysis protein [Xenorhabdus bovienii]|nr:lysis protein [Xenorhabdus bovienii]
MVAVMKADGKIVLVIIAGLIAWSSWLMASLNEVNDLNEKLTTDLNEQVAINTNQQARIQHLAELETKHIRELDNAKSEIDTLRADVAAARRKLRVQAICPVSETTSSRSMGDAGTPQLTEAARQDYYDLLRMMAENERQTKYLQDYVNTECYKVMK